MNVLVINGPNLNLLGTREKDHYGNTKLSDIEENLRAIAEKNALNISFFQSNAEHEIVDKIQSALNDIDGIIINPGAFTHTSVSIRDALLAVGIPFYEVHLSNIFSREEFRHHSFFSDIASGVICGMGPLGYKYALENIINKEK